MPFLIAKLGLGLGVGLLGCLVLLGLALGWAALFAWAIFMVLYHLGVSFGTAKLIAIIVGVLCLV